MKINKESLSVKVGKLVRNRNINANVVYSRYFFDCFLKRLSSSKYSDKFILKGGLFLSSVLGIENRSTMDIDFVIRKIRMERVNITSVIKEICQEKSDDNVLFKYINESEIKKDDIYGGFSVCIEGRLENIRQRFDIDIVAGDTIYPMEQDYQYKCLVTDETFCLKSYSIESVIAEKMQTFLSKGPFNSRAKDLYDLYILEKLFSKNNETLSKAFKKTCEYRKYNIDKSSAEHIVEIVLTSPVQRKMWDSYSRKTSYAKDIQFDDIIFSINTLIKIIM